MERDAVKGFRLSWVRTAARDVTLSVCFAGFAPMTALAQAVEPVSSPFIDAGTLPRDLTPWGVFLNADIVVKAVLIGLLLASVLTWTVWFAKSIEVMAIKWHLRRALRALARVKSSMEAVEQLANAGGVAGKFVDAAVA